MKICLIVHPNNKDTILDRIAHEIGKVFDEPLYHYGPNDAPRADHYFITHYSMLPTVLAQVNPDITPVTCFFTHNKGGLVTYVDSFNLCHSVIAESPEGMKELAALGVNQNILHFLPEGGDDERFKPHARTDNGAILVCGTNYTDGRKNPELIGKIIELLPNRQFKLMGNNWESLYTNKSYMNVSLWDFKYEEYPDWYAKCSVYLSCSKLEGGGPNSLIEAMHANLVPVVSDTGNARQYIVDGYNGFIFPLDATPEQVAELIEKAYKVNIHTAMPYADIWQTVREHTWPKYAMNMKEIITGDYSLTNSQNLDEIDYMTGEN